MKTKFRWNGIPCFFKTQCFLLLYWAKYFKENKYSGCEFKKSVDNAALLLTVIEMFLFLKEVN